MNDAIVIAIVGAESTGKSWLAKAMAERLGRDTGLACAAVGEWLREWCDREGRTPRRDEQADIARIQHARIDAAAQDHAVVLCDTTALMTAAYSRLLFQDDSLLADALVQQRRMSHTLLMALDIPWVADGLQRDGPQVRAPVDTLLRGWLVDHRLPFSVVGGQGPARLAAGVDAIAPALRRRASPRAGLFTQLAERNREAAARDWRCERCDDPECEHGSLVRRRAG